VATKIFLGLSAVVWIAYGFLCLLQPSYLEEAAGVTATTPTGTVELRAMYGGLQIAIGALCAVGLISARWLVHALVALAFLTAGLATSRLFGVLMGGGLSSYTSTALVFELGMASLAAVLARQNGEWATTA